MPKLKKPRTVDPNHRKIMKKLGALLAKESKSRKESKAKTKAPLRLAQLHLGEHGTALYSCRACGVAMAIIDCASSIAERTGYRFVETIRKNRLDLVSQQRRFQESVASFCSLHLARDRGTTKKSQDPVENVLVLQPEQMLFDEISLPLGQASTINEARGHLGRLLRPLQQALRRWDSLVSDLAVAEERMAGGIAAPSLAERRNRWPRDYVETKIDCYLTQHGWKALEIYAFHYGSDAAKGGNTGRIVKDRVDRARKSGKPALIWGWPGKEGEKEARRILDLVMGVLDKQNLSRN